MTDYRIFEGKHEGAEAPYFVMQEWNAMAICWKSISNEYPTAKLAELACPEVTEHD